MRQDMSRKVIEKPRTKGDGNRSNRAARRNKDFDSLPTKLTPRAQHRRYGSGNFKELTDKLSPLFRYLDKQIGRRWDDVFSEMREQLDSRDPIQSHIFEHVDQHIAINCKEVSVGPEYVDRPTPNEGAKKYWRRSMPSGMSKTGLISTDYFSNGYNAPSSVRPGTLYVCPRTNIIKRARLLYKEAAKPPKPVTQMDLPDGSKAVRTDGIWYVVKMKPYEIVKRWQWNYDEIEFNQANRGRQGFGYWRDVYVIDGNEKDHLRGIYYSVDNGEYVRRHSGGYLSRARERKGFVEVSRHQMNKRDMKRYNLVNETQNSK